MAFLIFFSNLRLRVQQTIELFSSHPRESFTTTITVTLPDVGDRFVNNPELRNCLKESSLIRTLDELPDLVCTLTKTDWREFQLLELSAIIHTQSFKKKEHWQKLHQRAFEELTSRPDQMSTALWVYGKYQSVAGLCKGDYFKNMFIRIVSQEKDLEHQMALWEEVLRNTTEGESVHIFAKHYREHQKLIAA
jgi:hypothetical protein